MSPLLSSLIRRLVNLIYLFKEATLCSIDYLYYFCFHYVIIYLEFYYFFLHKELGFGLFLLF